MKIKTCELTDVALDWAVAKCEDALHPLGNVVIEGRSLWLAIGGQAHVYMEEDVRYAPSDDWAQGGPLIEREGIELLYWAERGAPDPWEAQYGMYTTPEGKAHPGAAYIDQCPGDATGGPTPLIAAMRALVQRRLGSEVDVPNEFVEVKP